MTSANKLVEHFEHQHNNPPAPFNSAYNPNAAGYYKQVSKSMEEDGFYDSHSRVECAIEWRKRFDFLNAK